VVLDLLESVHGGPPATTDSSSHGFRWSGVMLLDGFGAIVVIEPRRVPGLMEAFVLGHYPPLAGVRNSPSATVRSVLSS
jgi:hypothetical protein